MPTNSFIRQQPTLSIIIIALKKQKGLASRSPENMRMPRFAIIPCIPVSMAQKRFITHLLPMDTVFTFGNTDLLRVIIICPGIKHIHPLSELHHRRSFNTFSLPRIFRYQNRLICSLRPAITSKRCPCRSRGHSNNLCTEIRGTRSIIKVILIIAKDHLRIYSSPAIPIT